VKEATVGVLNLDSADGSPSPNRPEIGSGFLNNLRDSGWLSFRGRIGRKGYWVAFGVAHLLLLVARFVLMLETMLFGFQRPTDLFGRSLGFAIGILGLILVVLYFWSLSASIVKRLHDLNITGWVALLCVFLGFFLLFLPFILLGCIRGTTGPNRYGSDPLAWD
jgi:uncharacterized membrane protein YhaH (DUF805 family)